MSELLHYYARRRELVTALQWRGEMSPAVSALLGDLVREVSEGGTLVTSVGWIHAYPVDTTANHG